MRIAVVGGGLFGCTAAIHLARLGHDVDLIEKQDQLMLGATRVNQFRFHHGYHYPRSDETVAECQRAKVSFTGEYGEAVIRDKEQYYAIAYGWEDFPDSKVTANEYEDFMWRNELPYADISNKLHFVNELTVNALFQVPEAYVDYNRVVDIVTDRLDGVNVMTGCEAHAKMRKEYDQIVVAAYAGTNDVLMALNCEPMVIQYEVVEKPIIRLPEKYRDTGIVVMDGPFFSVDPWSDGLHLMGHVEHAIWSRNIGTCPIVPDVLKNALWYTHYDGMHTKFETMRKAAVYYCRWLEEAEHVGSMYTVRAVLPNVDDTDERPTIVRRVDDKVTRVFSGKLTCCVDAAREVCGIVDPSNLDSKDRREKSAA